MSQNVWATIMPFGPVTNFLLLFHQQTMLNIQILFTNYDRFFKPGFLFRTFH